jgi:DNA-binding MarR family transcriptional regulator
MQDEWTPYVAAKSLMEIFPGLGRLMAAWMSASGEEEATMMQIGVLMHLKEQPITTSDLAKRRKVSMQSASVLVQGLVEKGWLTRIPDSNDRRRSLLQVTPEGLTRAKALQEQLATMVAEVLAQLTPDELTAASVFLPALRRVVASQMLPDLVPEK